DDAEELRRLLEGGRSGEHQLHVGPLDFLERGEGGSRNPSTGPRTMSSGGGIRGHCELSSGAATPASRASPVETEQGTKQRQCRPSEGWSSCSNLGWIGRSNHERRRFFGAETADKRSPRGMPMSSSTMDTERSIARCRVFLSIAAILAIYVDPTAPALT